MQVGSLYTDTWIELSSPGGVMMSSNEIPPSESGVSVVNLI